MTDQKTPTTLADDALDNATSGGGSGIHALTQLSQLKQAQANTTDLGTARKQRNAVNQSKSGATSSYQWQHPGSAWISGK
ncbi:MAG: hypothetical protein AAGK00_02770 [Pseudomonadota bacterium]